MLIVHFHSSFLTFFAHIFRRQFLDFGHYLHQLHNVLSQLVH